MSNGLLSPLARLRALVFSGKGRSERELVAAGEARVGLLRDDFENEALTIADRLLTLEHDIAADATSEEGAASRMTARRWTRELREASLLHNYPLIEVVTGSLLAWLEDHSNSPRLARALKAHARALRDIVNGKLRGDQAHARELLTATLQAELHADHA
ncbi:hypothetical protein [Roseiterribacter gracilis]|uniref:Uncharacterized protein n=1 Tax=Roseiterribacter gracilis TaxID=2812848 RepID=A0A8S8XHL4_9PROT|nr:hypothetical protein TMPK1_36360 [Rhodospirillales bacterium TMPK1]